MPDQFTAAERIAAKRGLTREQAGGLGLAPQRNAARAWAEDRFAGQIVAVTAPVMGDEGPTGQTAVISRGRGLRGRTAEKLAPLPPVLPDGIHTAGNPSQISDGAAAVLLMSEE